jgi:eukaryotic-like serine/threonine-protein kinase
VKTLNIKYLESIKLENIHDYRYNDNMGIFRIFGLFSVIAILFAPIQSLCQETGKADIEKLVLSLSDKDVFVQQKAVQQLSKIGNNALPELMKALDSDNRDACANAIETIGLIGNQSAIPKIIEVLKSHCNKEFKILKDEYIRVNAIVALGRLKATEAVYVLEDIMNKERQIDKAWCLISLYQIDTSENRLQALMQMAKDDDSSIRNVIIRFLGSTKNNQVLPILIEALKDKEWYVRDTAVQGIAFSGTKEQIKIITPLLDDPNPIVVETTKKTIETIKNK